MKFARIFLCIAALERARCLVQRLQLYMMEALTVSRACTCTLQLAIAEFTAVLSSLSSLPGL